MPRPETWLSRTPSILAELAQAEEGRTFGWHEVAALFGIQRREASRIIFRLQPESQASQRDTTARRVKRSQLLEWLEPIKEKFERAAELTQKLREDEAERQAKRAVFHQRFGEVPPSWKVTAELESATITSLPAGVRLAPGKIEIIFAGDNPIAACELLHALSKAMERDWFRFCAAIAPEAVESGAKERAKDPIEAFLRELEQQRSERIGS